MDKHIHMSWCGFDAFKTLAKNNLGLYTHSLFPEIRDVIVDKAIAPADVSEVLLKKKRYPTEALEALLEFLHKSPSISEKPVVKLTLDEDSQSLTDASQTNQSKAQVDLLSVDDFQIPTAKAEEGTTYVWYYQIDDSFEWRFSFASHKISGSLTLISQHHFS